MASHEPIRRRGGSGSPARESSDKLNKISGLEIPDKLYFRIGEVAKLCGVAAYVLRFWEQEFPQLRPNKGGTGQRLYRRRDVETALRIKTLLYDEGYTIPGARQAFKAGFRKRNDGQLALGVAEPASIPIDSKGFRALRKEMSDLHTMLSWPADMRVGKAGVQPIRGGSGAQTEATPVRRVAKPISIAPSGELFLSEGTEPETP